LPSVIDLPWLEAGVFDVRAALLALQPGQPRIGEELQRIAGNRLKASEAVLFGKRVRHLRSDGATFAPLLSISIAILSNGTFDLVIDELPAATARHGIASVVTAAPFDQVMQSALDPASEVNRPGIDAVLVAVDHRWFGLDGSIAANPENRLAEAVDQLTTVVTALRSNGGHTVILQTVPVPPQPLFGSFDVRVAGSQRALIQQLNTAVPAIAAETSSVVADIAALAAQVGADLWFDPASWNLYKLPFSPACNAIYADFIARLLGSVRGRTRKCLVLDLDNTLWGGVIGDDGVDALKIGQGSADGEAFLAIQKMALALKNRGIILAVASKNDDEVARGPFRNHPDMLLRESDIAVFQANWLDKPSNLEAIAKKLNIGVDALVFLDDNPAERAQVRAALPSVATPELPGDPAWFPWYLANAGYFEAVSFSNEDRLRAESYAANARRAEVSTKARDLGDYLASLEIEIQFAPFDAMGRPRIMQLINKSNQFNLTTRRYTEVDILAYEQDNNALTLQVRLADRFGDFGMIGVIIGLLSEHEVGRTLTLDTWLMSCRVLGRRVDEAMLSEMIRLAKGAEVERIVGIYIPTEKNHMVAEHYTKLGFAKIDEEENGVCRYNLDVSTYRCPDLPHKVSHVALAPVAAFRVASPGPMQTPATP
jgi:FkbH-like protein